MQYVSEVLRGDPRGATPREAPTIEAEESSVACQGDWPAD